MEEDILEAATEEAPALEASVEKTPEQQQREDYARRNLEAIAEREDVLRRNRVIGPTETLTMDTEAAIRQRCCF